MKRLSMLVLLTLLFTLLAAQTPQGKIYSVGKFTCGFTDQGVNSLVSTGSNMLTILADSSLYQYKPGHGYMSVPAGNNFVFATGSSDVMLAIDINGHLTAWGDNTYGQCNVPDGVYLHAATDSRYCVAVRSDGSIAAWGSSTNGCLNVPAGNNFRKVFAGFYSCVAVTAEGNAVAWGVDSDFDYGYVTNVKKIEIGGFGYIVFLTTNGILKELRYTDPPDPQTYLYTYPGSYLDFDIVGNGNTVLTVSSDGTIGSWPDAVTVPAGNNYVSVIGSPFFVGLTSNGQLVSPDQSYNIFNFSIPGFDYTCVTAGWQGIIGLKADGSLGGYVLESSLTEGLGTLPSGNDFIAVDQGYWHALALRSDHSIVGWGWDDYNQYNFPDTHDYIAISATHAHSLALRSDGSLIVRGNSSYGLWDVPAGNDFVKIDTESNRCLALRADGTLVAWGSNYYGVNDCPAGNDYVDIACGRFFSMALKSDGSIVVWGQDGYPNPPGNGYVKMAAGFRHYVCLRSDGTLYQFDDYTSEGECEPPPADLAWLDMSAGYSFTAFLREEFPTSIDDEQQSPAVLPVLAYPNPARPGDLVNFKTLLNPGEAASLNIYNLKGQLVKSISVNPVSNLTIWNGRSDTGSLCASGMYLFRLKAGNNSITRKLLLMK